MFGKPHPKYNSLRWFVGQPKLMRFRTVHHVGDHGALKFAYSGLRHTLPTFPISLVLWVTCWEVCLNYSVSWLRNGAVGTVFSLGFGHRGTISTFGKAFSVIYITLIIKIDFCPFILLFCFSSLAGIHSCFEGVLTTIKTSEIRRC